MKKHPEETAVTREKLMQAFWGLYCQKKIDHISVKEITDKAGYHRSTFYEYFVDIYDLLNQLEDELLAKLKEKVAHGPKVESNDDIVQTLADFYESQGKYLRVFFSENGDPHFAKKMKAVIRPVLLEKFGMLESEIHTAYIFEFGISAIIASITHWYQNNKNLPSKELVVLIRSMLLYGVFPMIQKYSTLPANAFL